MKTPLLTGISPPKRDLGQVGNLAQKPPLQVPEQGKRGEWLRPFFSVETYRLVPLSALAVVAPGSYFANWNSSFNPQAQPPEFLLGFHEFTCGWSGADAEPWRGQQGKTGAEVWPFVQRGQ